MVKESNEAENEPSALEWQWKPEIINDTTISGIGEVSFDSLLDQKAANDTSDYLWYMTRYFIYFYKYLFLITI